MISHLFRASNYVSIVTVLSYRALNLLQQIRLAKRGIVLASIADVYTRHSLGPSLACRSRLPPRSLLRFARCPPDTRNSVGASAFGRGPHRGSAPLRPNLNKNKSKKGKQTMRKRNNRIVFYLNDEELAALTAKVQKSKFPREKFIRITLANKRITEMPPVDYSHLIFEMRRTGQNLHRLLVIATANHFFEAADIQSCLDDLKRVERKIHSSFFAPQPEPPENTPFPKPFNQSKKG